MATCSVADLIDQACASGFKCLDEQTFRALLLQLLCNVSSTGLPPQFESDVFEITPGTTLNTVAHGLGSTPSYVRAVLVCIANDAGTGAVVGDEISVESVFENNLTAPNFGIKANAASVFLTNTDFFAGQEGAVYIITNGAATNATSVNNFGLKIYAME